MHLPTKSLPLAKLIIYLSMIQGWGCHGEIIISEIYYNQTGPDNAEFLEVHNPGTEAMDIGGYHFDNGILYTFPGGTMIDGGGHLVLVWSVAGFSASYPGVPITGIYMEEGLADPPGALDKGGERVTLRNASGVSIFSVRYDNAAPWPELADADGYSLVPYRTDSPVDPDEPFYWRHSMMAGGSPGTSEHDPGLPPVYINEIRTRDGLLNNDVIELHNPNPDPIDIGDWYLSDNVSAVDGVGVGRKKYRIPAGTSIPGNGYLLFGESTLGFSLSSRGERVFLYSGNAVGQLTGYVHGFFFGPAADGITFGRYVNGDGFEQLVPQESPTLGAANSGPRVNSLVITEAMYNQPSAIEYIEFQNNSGSAIQLANGTDLWRLSDSTLPVSHIFTFPAGQTIAPGEIFLVMNTNLAVFTAAHDVPAGVKIYGPYSGNMSNGGERVNLERPERLNTTNPLDISYIVVETLQYGDDAPWPNSPDGTGNSLTRRDLEAYADESGNWRASLEGGGSPGWNTNYEDEPIYVNEALTHTDFPSVDVVELFNPNAGSVDISGWYLSDNRSDPRKFLIPPGTIISGGGFFCVNEDHDADPLTAAPAGYFGNAFSLSSRGEDLYITSATADGRLSGYQHGFAFNGSANGVSFGRYLDSLGEEHFTAQQSVTIAQDRNVANPAGATNDDPLVGPLVVSEIYYQNTTGDVEFVELQNISAGTVNLYDDTLGGQATNTWTVSGIDFTFPVPLPSIAAGDRMILLPLNTDVAGFRSSNNVPPGVVIYGGSQGYLGALNNGGERLTLVRPDKPDLVQPGNIIVVPRIDVDTIRYDDDPPWPTVGENGGRSIERIDVNAFGDDLINWRTSNPEGGTPGTANSTGTVYGVWELNTFTFEERNTPGLTGPDEDFNSDGLINLRVYAAGFDAHATPDPTLLSHHLVVEDAGQDYLVILHRRRINASDLTWIYERSDDLVIREPADSSSIPKVDNGDGTETWFIRDTLPMSSRNRSFVEIRLSFLP
jgi:hypothetical protein